jgi:hypothetical protein
MTAEAQLVRKNESVDVPELQTLENLFSSFFALIRDSMESSPRRHKYSCAQWGLVERKLGDVYEVLRNHLMENRSFDSFDRLVFWLMPNLEKMEQLDGDSEYHRLYFPVLKGLTSKNEPFYLEPSRKKIEGREIEGAAFYRTGVKGLYVCEQINPQDWAYRAVLSFVGKDDLPLDAQEALSA